MSPPKNQSVSNPDGDARFKFVRRRAYCAAKGRFCQARRGKYMEVTDDPEKDS